MTDNASKWGKATAAKRYASGGSPSSKRGSGPFPGQSEKEFYDTESRRERSKVHGTGADLNMTDTDTVSIDKANNLAVPRKDRSQQLGWKTGGKVR